uniref:Uncharacterized protein n=1 Tax=Anguilla anguilla TaxID=7936 RepID=A0A0E9QY35_ANGAN
MLLLHVNHTYTLNTCFVNRAPYELHPIVCFVNCTQKHH